MRLWQFGKLLPPKLADHLEQHGALPVLYVSAWLLTSFSADFPLYFASRVMDVVLSDSVYEGGMKVRCLAAKEFVDRRSVVHCAACRLLLAVTEGPTGHTCGKCHRRYSNMSSSPAQLQNVLYPSASCQLPYACLTANAEVSAAETPALQPLCQCSIPAGSRPLNPGCHMQVALGIVLHCEKSLLKMEDMEEMVDFLKSEVGSNMPALTALPCQPVHGLQHRLLCL